MCMYYIESKLFNRNIEIIDEQRLRIFTFADK